MEIIYQSCAGLDVHQETVEVNVRRREEGGKLYSEVRRFRTFTRDLLELSDWLAEQGVTHVAMESTGVFWKPIYNILEGRFEVLLVNARHIKHVPGRKTDTLDCQWLAQLLQCGLLKASFVPPREIRDLRDLTRHRAQLIAERTRAANRIHKILEDTNIKLGAVATDILGVSGRAMLQQLIAGEDDPAKLSEQARGRLKQKKPELRLALQGTVSEHHRFMLQLLWDQLTQLEALLQRLEERIEEQMAPFEEAITRLDEIPGIDRRVAQVIAAEIGLNMGQFPSDRHLSSWAGMCSGNNQSAGKRKSGRTSPGSRWLKQALVQAAWAASHTKNSYLAAQYQRLVRRRGKKRALVAVGHSILVALYHVLQGPERYQDLGPNYFDLRDQRHVTKYLVKRLESLGHKVTLEPCPQAA
jgi:transposase